MEACITKDLFPIKFKLISFYEEEWNNSKTILSTLKDECQNKDISLEEKFQKLSTIIQNFEKQNKDVEYDNKNLKNKCIN